MSEIAVLTTMVKTTLLDVAKQAAALGVGLQNVAPSKTGESNYSVQYLLTISEDIVRIAEECEK